ncbi:MAG: hypothetical protein ACKVW3_00570 [Phycisphaerales bacterium]
MAKRKPWYRARNVCLGIVAIVVGLIVREVVLALTAEPGRAIDYGARAVEHVEANQPKGLAAEEPNLWPKIAQETETFRALLVEAAGGGGAPVEIDVLYAPSVENRPDGWSLETARAAALAAMELAKQRGMQGRMAEIAAGRRFVRPAQPGHLFEWLLPELGGMRSMARYSAARMALAREKGDWPEFVRAYEEGMSLARAATMQFTLIDGLVGYAIASLMATRVREALVVARPDEATLAALLVAHDRQARLTPASRSLEGERIGCLDTIQWSHTDDGRGSGRLILTQLNTISSLSGSGGGFAPGSLAIINIGSVAFPSKRAVSKRANEFFDAVVAYADKPRSERAATGFDPDTWVETLPRRHVLLRMLAPAVGKAVGSWDQTRLQLDGTRTMIAIEIFERRNGKYPATLADLAPGVIAQVPTDPYSTGSLAYRVIDGDPAGRKYLLYTIGADGKDNNGHQAEKEREKALRDRGGIGLDYVLNDPPKK